MAQAEWRKIEFVVGVYVWGIYLETNSSAIAAENQSSIN